MSEAAVEALTRFAVIAPQLDERLAGEGIAAGNTTFFEETYHIVLLGRETMEYVDSPFGHCVVANKTAIRIYYRHNDIDYQYIYRIAAKRSGIRTEQFTGFIGSIDAEYPVTQLETIGYHGGQQ